MARDEDAVKPTSALSAMINSRSLASISKTSSSSNKPPTPSPSASPSTSSSALPAAGRPSYRSTDSDESALDPIRRRNLTLSGTPTESADNQLTSQNKEGSPNNGVTNPKKRILVPNSSPMRGGRGEEGSEGGFLKEGSVRVSRMNGGGEGHGGARKITIYEPSTTATSNGTNAVNKDLFPRPPINSLNSIDGALKPLRGAGASSTSASSSAISNPIGSTSLFSHVTAIRPGMTREESSSRPRKRLRRGDGRLIGDDDEDGDGLGSPLTSPEPSSPPETLTSPPTFNSPPSSISLPTASSAIVDSISHILPPKETAAPTVAPIPKPGSALLSPELSVDQEESQAPLPMGRRIVPAAFGGIDGKGKRKLEEDEEMDSLSSPPVVQRRRLAKGSGQPTNSQVITISDSPPRAAHASFPTPPLHRSPNFRNVSLPPSQKPTPNPAMMTFADKLHRLSTANPDIPLLRIRSVLESCGERVEDAVSMLAGEDRVRNGRSGGRGGGAGGAISNPKPFNLLNHKGGSQIKTSIDRNLSSNSKKPSASSSIASSSKKAAAPPRPKKKKIILDSDEDSAGDYSDEDSDANGVEDNDYEGVVTESEALKFFNECAVKDLPELTACTPEQAQMVIDMRPFETAADLRTKLRKKKGVNSNLFDSYMELMDGYHAVDECLKRCEKEGSELSRIMNIWAGRGGSAAPSIAPSALNSQTSTRLGTPDTESTTTSTGVHLIQPTDEALTASSDASAPEEVRKAFEGYLRKQPASVPDGIALKDYQLLGVNWLYLLYKRNTSCILADEMGLGKTAQVIALLAHLKEVKAKGPHLVIVPSSTLDNWLREFSVFAPSLEVRSYYGSQGERVGLRHEMKEEKDTIDVVVTTYNMATGAPDDRKFLRKMEFKTCTFDEGHQLKNSESKKYKELMDIKVNWRLLLTGTPLQNNLQELVSLLSFILPKHFRDAGEDLRAIFKVPAEAQQNLLSRERVSRAKQMMAPYVLRRKKAQVLKDLPKKLERIEYCDMSNLQKTVYRETMVRSKKALMDPTKTGGPLTSPETRAKKNAASKTGRTSTESSSANVLMDLRKAANHPMLFRRLYDDKKLRNMAKDCLKELEFMDRDSGLIYEDMEVMTDFELHRFCQQYPALKKYALKKDEWMQAGKIQILKKLIPELKEQGDRILVFSQFTQVLDILESVLKTMDIKYLKLTGQTNVGERQGMVDDFTKDKSITVFLLSTRAGGLGLNLMAANVCIIHDQDFNPHNDRQAEDRAYRLGQTRDVTVIKLITKGTIEEDIMTLARTKLDLDEHVSRSNGAIDPGLANAPGQPSKMTVESLDEGDEAQVEKKMKTSLLTTLTQRWVQEEGSDGGAKAEGDGEDSTVNGDEELSQSLQERAKRKGEDVPTPDPSPKKTSKHFKK